MQSINTNVSSLNAQRNLSSSGADLATSLQRLSSGMRINSAKDDAAGLAIASRFTTQIRGMDQAARNANDGISLSQTAEGSMGEISNNLQRIRELAVQSRNATNSATDRQALNAEAQQLKLEIDRVAKDTSFNGTKLLDGSFTNQAFQVGANQGETIAVARIVNANSAALGSWVSSSTTTPAVTASYSSLQLSSLDFSQSAQSLVGASVSSTLTAGDFSTTNATFSVGSSNVTLADNYAGDFDLMRADILTQLGGTNSPFTVGGTGSNITFTSKSSATAFNITGSTGGVADASGNAGTAARATSNVNFTVGSGADAKNVSLTANYTGNQGSMISAIQGSVGSAYVVTAEGASGFKIASATSGAATQVSLSNVSQSSISGVQGGATVTGADQRVDPGNPQTGFANLDISTAAGADAAMLAMDGALTAINGARADMGAIQNRFSSVVANLSTTSENLSASRSRIEDTDYAKESAQLSRNQILQQAGTAMLAQANQASQGVLSLLR